MALAVMMTVSMVSKDALASGSYYSTDDGNATSTPSIEEPGSTTYDAEPQEDVKTYSITVGQKIKLGYSTEGRNHNYKSSDTAYVEVDTNGMVAGVGVGDAKIIHEWTTGGFLSPTITNTETFKIEVTAGQYTITYDLNGGTGTTPDSVTGTSGDLITVPGGDGISREGYELLGWAKVRDASSVSSGVQPTIYSLGSEFVISDAQTLYAVWANNAHAQRGIIKIAIRNDGNVPDEPSIQNASYEFLAGPSDNQGINANNVLEYFSPAHTVSGVANVKNALQDSFYSYVNGKNSNNRYWNNETQYVEWYVIKYQGGDGGDNCWHIDGVVREKSKVNLRYNRNGATGGLAPDGKQYFKGDFAKVEQGTLTKDGYTFIGWNTEADGTGKDYQAGDSIEMLNETILYAKWQRDESKTKKLSYTVEYYRDDVIDSTKTQAVEKDV